MTKGSGRYKRQTVSFAALEAQVNAAERAVQHRSELWSADPPEETTRDEWKLQLLRQMHRAITDARIMRNRLTDAQWEDPAYQALSRRIDDAERFGRTALNPLGAVQSRIDRALERLRQEPDAPFIREITEILTKEST